MAAGNTYLIFLCMVLVACGASRRKREPACTGDDDHASPCHKNQTGTLDMTKNEDTLYIIDCDPGIDDASGLLVALNDAVFKNTKVLAVTIAPGNAPALQAFQNAFRVLKAADKTKVPIYMGVNSPIINIHESDNYFGVDAFGDRPDVEPVFEDADLASVQEEHAVNAIVRLARENPGKIRLIGLGPPTNIAMALQMEPNLPKLLKDTYMMGGNMNGVGNVKAAVEFNFHIDPEAAHLAIRELHPVLLTWELVLKYPVEWEWYDSYISANTKSSKFLGGIEEALIKRRRNGGNKYELVDAALVACALDPTLITKLETRPAEVELKGKGTRGMMVVDWRAFADPEYHDVRLILEVDIERVKKYVYDSVRPKH